MNKKTAISAFTFVEFALIILLISLVFAGVMVGKELVNQSQIRSSLSQIQSYYTAINSFYERYKAIPGDMDNATSFWGSYPTCPYNISNKQTSVLTCNGDNDKRLSEALHDNITSETFLFWQHLSNAGLIKGEYTGRSGRNNRFDVMLNINTPTVAIPGGGVSIQPYGVNYALGGDTKFPKNSRHYFVLGSDAPGIDDGKPPNDWKFYPYTGFRLLSSIDALSIDEKLDDGMPGLGTIHTRRGPKSWKTWDHYTCTDDVPASGTLDMDARDVESRAAAQTARYDPNLDGPQCYLLFQIDFST